VELVVRVSIVYPIDHVHVVAKYRLIRGANGVGVNPAISYYDAVPVKDSSVTSGSTSEEDSDEALAPHRVDST
jgi:hypothetical protein